MRPLAILITINICFLAIFLIFSTFVIHGMYAMPLFTTAMAGLNGVGIGLARLDKKPEFVSGFLAGFLISAVAATASWIWFVKHAEEIQRTIGT